MPLLESDPQDILLDADQDVVLDEEGLHWVSGIDAVVQAARIRIRLFFAEWFLNLDVGIDYYADILFENYDETRARAAFATAILDTPGIVEILSLTLRRDSQTRILTVTWSARTLFGDTMPDSLDLSGPTTLAEAA